MAGNLREVYQDNIQSFKNAYRFVRDIRRQAAANRALNPHHPAYERQFKRDIGRGMMAAGVVATASVGLLVHTLGIEARSEARAEEQCNQIVCKENVLMMNAQKGTDPYLDPRFYERPSFMEVRANLDEHYWEEDRKWVNMGAAICLPADILAGLYLMQPILAHRRRMQLWEKQKDQN